MTQNKLYTQSALVDVIKKQLGTVILDKESYERDLDFSDNPKIPFDIDYIFLMTMTITITVIISLRHIVGLMMIVE